MCNAINDLVDIGLIHNLVGRRLRYDYHIFVCLRHNEAQYNHRVVFEADTFFPSSKLCSNCGTIHKHLTLADRTYICPSCGFTIDRDINAAINLKEKMKQTLIGGVTAEFMRVDPHRLSEDLAINQVKAMAYEARI